MILTRENIASIDVDFLINQKIAEGKSNELLLIVPTNRKVRNVKKEVISSNPNKAAYGLNIETLGTISTKMLSEVKPFKQLSEAASTIFIKQCASELELRYLSHYKDEIPFGTLDKIKNVISEYKRQGITYDVLRKEAGQLEKTELNKALDIANIYERYQKKCNDLTAFEIGDVYRELNQITNQDFCEIVNKIYPDIDLIVFSGFSEFSNPEIGIIKKISSSKNAKTFITFDYDLTNDQLFSHLDKCYEQLGKTGFKKIIDQSIPGKNNFIAVLKENLFKWKGVKQSNNFSQKLFKIEAHDREHEVELIAKEIKTLIVEKKVEPHKISVVFNLIQNYSSIVRDVFEKNGLPFNLTDRTPLDNSNPVTAVVNFLEIAENNFYFKNVFRALSSKFIDIAGVDVSNLYRVSSELNIVAGKINWIDSISDSIANYNHKGDDESDSDRKKTAYIKALEDIRKIENLLKPFEEKFTIEEFDKLLKDFIVKSCVATKLLQIEMDQEKNIRAVAEFIETVSEIFMLLREENGEEKKFPLNYFMDQIRTACGWARFNVKEKSNYGIQVTNLEEIRGLNFDYLFIGGMIDGDFPTRYNPEIFFSGSFKKKAQLHQLEERYMFYQSLCSWNKRLYLSYPRTESARETVVSTFLIDIETVFLFSKIAEENFTGKIFSQEDVQILIGKTNLEAITDIFEKSIGVNLNKITNSLRTEKIRTENPFADSPYNGIILSAENDDDGNVSIHKKLSDKLKQYSSKQYSISQLEVYAKCPFKFFVERVLGIETVEEPTEDIEAIEMGRLLHEIIYEFYTTIRQKKIKIVGCDDNVLESVEDILFGIAEKQIKTTAFKSPLTFYEKEKILGLNGNRKESILFRFLETEQKCDDQFIPMFFEVSFGRIKEGESDMILSISEPIQIDNIKLRGKIDRIEVNEKIKSFNVVDYKLSGAKPSFEDLKIGISLQLPVYLFATSKLLSKKFGGKYSPNEMFIYSLKYAVDEFGRKLVRSRGSKDDEIQSVEQLIDNTIEQIKKYIQQISEGKFGLSPHENREKIVCRYCQFRQICRIDDVN